MNSLNDDCLYNILLHIPNETINNCSVVNKQFNKCYKIEMLWMLKVTQTYDNYVMENTWFDTFKINTNLLYLMNYFNQKYSLIDYYNTKHIVSRNNFEYIPKQIGNLINLEFFRTHNNPIEDIQDEIKAMKNYANFNITGKSN